jgi:hypothetical protein
MVSGFSTSNYYLTSKYSSNSPSNTPLVHYGWAESKIEGTITYSDYITNPLPFDVIISLSINVILGSTSTIDVLMPAKKPNGTVNNTANYRHDRGLCILDGTPVVRSIRPASGTDPGFIYSATDASSDLIVNSTDKRIVSCSAVMSANYNAPFFFSGSTVIGTPAVDTVITQYNTYCLPEYPFQLNPGDLVRFDRNIASPAKPTTNFQEANEYMILSVNSTGSPVTFTLNKEVNDGVTGSVAYHIDRYVFSRKFDDETNVIITHQISPGQTSGGIIKNVNLQLAIDDKAADIVSELKSKIFSTVLIP